MRKWLKNYWALILILSLAAVLRLYQLGTVPPSLMWDETALGYNAYSILKTGRDEYGNFLPLIFNSFGDFKPGLYVYLTVPTVAIFGLTEFAVRLPSAILGIFTVYLIYFLVKELFSKEKFSIGEIAALVLAISPWHIEFSHGAWEANLAVFLVVAGVFTFLKSLQNNRVLPVAVTLFGLTFLAYQGAKVFTPLLLVGLFIFYFRDIKKISRKVLFISLMVLIILFLPSFLSAFGSGGGRAKVMSVFSYPRGESDIQEITAQDKTSQASLVFKVFHSETLNFTRGILGRYFNHFSGRFLFFEGDWSNKRLGVPYMGVMYFGEIIFLLSGIYFLLRRNGFQMKNFLFYWLLISPLPAAITRDSISAVRALNMVIPLAIIVGAGISQLANWLKNQPKVRLSASRPKPWRSLVCCLLFVVYAWNFVYFLDQYFVHAPIHNSTTSQYGYREVVRFVVPIAKDYDKIAFTQKYGQPYIYWLFYTQYDPKSYQKQARLTVSQPGDVGQVERIDNIEFRNFHWLSDINIASLFIGDDLDLPERYLKEVKGARLLKEIYFLNGQLAFRVVEKK